MRLASAFLQASMIMASCTNEGSCSPGGHASVCMDKSCCSGGTLTSGLCPGGSNIECCTHPACSTPRGSGHCMSTSECSGTPVSGYCVGPSDIQCCVSSGPTPPTPPTPHPSTSRGVDLAGDCSAGTLACMVKAGYGFGIFRAWHSTGSFDTSACPNIVAAHAQGMSTTDVYMFPCPKCSASPQTQLSSMISGLKSAGCTFTRGSQGKSNFGKVWLDVENPSYWGSQSSNQAFFKGLVQECESLGIDCGVYSSASQWVPLFGSSFTAGSSLPLWYAHYDNEQSFNDFSPFGGWSTPYMKQYNGDTTVCGFGVDLDWTPHNPATNLTNSSSSSSSSSSESSSSSVA